MHELKREKQPFKLFKKADWFHAYLYEVHIREEAETLKKREKQFKENFFHSANLARDFMFSNSRKHAELEFRKKKAWEYLENARKFLNAEYKLRHSIFSLKGVNDFMNIRFNPPDSHLRIVLEGEINALVDQIHFLDEFPKPGVKSAKAGMIAWLEHGKRLEAHSLLNRAIDDVKKQEHEIEVAETVKQIGTGLSDKRDRERAFLDAVKREYFALLDQLEFDSKK